MSLVVTGLLTASSCKSETKNPSVESKAIPEETRTGDTIPSVQTPSADKSTPHTLSSQNEQESQLTIKPITVPEEELNRVIGDGSAKAELDYLRNTIAQLEALNETKATTAKIFEVANQASYSAIRLNTINEKAPLSDNDINECRELMRRLNAVMGKYMKKPTQ